MDAEDDVIAVRRQRRQAKPNMMDDHIYFASQKQNVSKSQQLWQLRERRQAKQAAKEFQKQKQKAEKQKQASKVETNLDFSKFSIADDDEVNNQINQMKMRIRKQSKDQIKAALQKT